jgi:RND family efflux transporter MFP subunit
MNLTTTPPTGPLPLSSAPSPPETPVAVNGVRRIPRSQPRRRGLAWKLPIGIVLFAGSGWAAKQWFWPTQATAIEVTAMAARGDLPIVVTERGELESSKTTTVKCEVEVDAIKIVSVLPEGTRLKKGQEVLRFDADKLTKNLAEQEVKYELADGKYKAAVQELEVQKNKAESETAKAQLALTLADLDLEKYIKGEYQADLDDKKGAINLAEKELQDAKEKLKHYETFVKKGFGTPEQLRLKELEVERAKNNVERDKAKLMVLEKYTKKRQEAELTAKADDAKRELARTKSSGEANIAKAKADLQAAKTVADLEKHQLERVRKQLEFAVVKAPEDGILVYAQARVWDPNSRIQIGGMVSFQQPLFHLPELDRMQVKVRVHESKVKKLKVDQKAEIRVEAYQNKVMHGTVKSVATLADSEYAWRRGGVKEYETIVTIDDLPSDAALKPGMTAEVSIKVNHFSDVIRVPVQAITEIEGQHFAYVVGPAGVERREVTVGESNEKYVQIATGMEEGERVSLDARARGAAETTGKPKEQKEPESKPEERKMAIPPVGR